MVVKYLADTYGGFAREYEDFDADDDYDEFYCAYDESELSKIKQSLVCRKNLAKCIEKLELEEFLIMGESDVQQQIWKQDSVKEDLFEAIVGAVTLDSQWNFDQIEDAVKIMLGDTLSDFSDEETNYVNEVQQWCLWKNESMPLYHYEGRENLFNIFGILVFQESFSLFQIKIIECMTVFISHLTFIAWSISEIKAYHCFALVVIPKVMRVIGLVREFMRI